MSVFRSMFLTTSHPHRTPRLGTPLRVARIAPTPTPRKTPAILDHKDTKKPVTPKKMPSPKKVSCGTKAEELTD